MTRTTQASRLIRPFGLAAAVAVAACTGPVLSPVHPMTAFQAPGPIGGTLGFGIGSVTGHAASVHDTKVNTFVDGDLELAPIPRLVLSGGLGYSAPHPLLTIIPGGAGATAAAKLVLIDWDCIALAVAPRAAAAVAANDTNPADRATALQAPLLFSLKTGSLVLTLQGWYRYFPTLQTATTVVKPGLGPTLPNITEHEEVHARGHAWGGAAEVDFGRPGHFGGALFIAGESVKIDEATGNGPPNALKTQAEFEVGLSIHDWRLYQRAAPPPGQGKK